ncbi:hypothetical protein TrVGV298_007718 [Trichoderma virens]|nr:hypothetical protein TrVGV298_007718 [Trichoderma virens]
MAKSSEPPNYPQPPILKRNGFQFRKGVLSVDSIDRVDGSRLNELFNPTTLRLKRDQKDAAEKACQLFKKPFFAAQLRYYDIPFKSSASKTELQLLLQDAVRQGKCNHVPNSVTELEASMRADYEPLQQDERAAFDLHRFVDMYFLTNGEPDKTKTTEVLALQRSPYSEWEVHDMARENPRVAYP